MDSLETKLQQLQTAYQQFYTSLGTEELWKGTLTGLTSYIEQLNNMPKLFGKIPVAAINIIVPAINTLKNLLLSLLEQIAKKYQTWLHELPTQGASEAAEQSEKTGKNIVERFLEGMRSIKPQVEKERDAILAAAGMQTEKAQAQTKKVSSAFTFLQESLSYKGGAAAGEEAYLMAAYNELNSAGLIQGLNPAKMSTEELRAALQNVIDTYNQTGVAALQAGQQGQQAALATANGFQAAKAKLQAFSNVWKGISTARNIVSTLGLSLQTLAAGLDQSTEGAAALSITIQGLAGIMTAFSYSNPILAALSAILAVGTTVYQLVKNGSLEKQIERATEKAKELSEEALLVKDELKSLDSGIKKYEQLKEKRYESAEAAEEYQEQVDSLADSYPELIKGFDATGEAILDASAAERELAALRKESAVATAEAAAAEAREKELELQGAQERLNDAIETIENVNALTFTSTSFFDEWTSLWLSGLSIWEQIRYRGSPESKSLTDTGSATISSESFYGDGEYSYIADKLEKADINELLQKGSFEKAILADLIQSEREFQYRFTQNPETGVNSYEITDGEGNTLFSQSDLKNLTNDYLQGNIDLSTFFTNLESSIPDEAIRNHILSMYELSDSYKEYKSALAEVESLQQSLNISLMSEATKAANAALLEQEAYKDNSALATLFNYSLGKQYEKEKESNPSLTFSDFKTDTQIQEDFTRYEDIYGSWSDTTRELFDEMIGNIETYSAEAVKQTFGLDENNPVSGLVDEYYASTAKNNKNRIVGAIAQTLTDTVNDWEGEILTDDTTGNDYIKNNFLSGKLKEFYDKIYEKDLTENETDAAIDALEQYSSLIDKGFADKANDYLSAWMMLYDAIYDIGDAAERDVALSMLKGYDLTSYSGIYEARESLEDYYEEIGQELPQELTNYLNIMRDSLVNNLSLSFATLTESVISKIEEITGAIDGATEALDFTDALSLYRKLIAAEGNEGKTFDELFERDATDPTKYILKESEVLKNWREHQYRFLEEEANYLEEQVEEAKQVFSFVNSIGDIYWTPIGKTSIESALGTSDSTNYSSSNDFWEAVKANSILNDSSDSWYTDKNTEKSYTKADVIALAEKFGLQDVIFDYYSGVITDYDTFVKKVQETLKGAEEDAKVLTEATEIWKNTQSISGAIDLGQYAEAIKLINSTFAEDEASKTKWLNYVHTQAQSAYSSMIEDFAKGGAELVKKNAATYGADFESLATNFNYDGAVQELDSRYENGEYSQKEYNEQRAALEEAQRSISNALDDSLTSIITNASSITEENISDFANALGKDYDTLTLELTENEDGTFSASLDAIRQFITESYEEDIPAAVEDTLRKYLSSVVKYFENGINGKATLEDITNLKTAFGLDGLDYTETLDGFQLTRSSIYKTLAKVREQDSLTFDTMVKSYAKELADIDEGYDDIYSVMRKIADIEEEINSGKVNGDRLDLLNAELAVAKEIEQTLKDADNTFNFMDRDLPSGFDDPMSAWEGVGDAMKVLNGDDFAEGKMDFTDFYNMIDFMGDEFVASAFGFEGDAITAAELIEAGANAINMVDGEMFVDFSKLGENFNTSADGMKEGITEGIHKVARSQIEMLDAAIGVLETIVAMEELTKVDLDGNGLLDFGEIFKVDDSNNPTDFTEKYEEVKENIVQALEKSNVDLKKTFIGEYSLDTLLSSSFEELEQLNMDWEQYQQIINSLYQAVINGEYDSSDISSIFKTISSSLGEASTFTVGKKTFHISSTGKMFTIDFEDDNTQELLENLNTTYDDKKQYVIDWLNGKEVDNLEANIETLLKITNQYVEEDGNRYYIDSNGARHNIPQGEDLSQFVAGIEQQVQKDAVAGKTNVEGEITSTTINGGTKVDFVYSCQEGEYIGHYKGNTYTGSSFEEVEKQIAEAAQAELKKSEAGLVKTGTTTIDGEVYTQYTLNGETIIVDQNGKQLSAEELNKRALEAAGIEPTTEEIPLNINLSIVGMTTEQASSYATSLTTIQNAATAISGLDFSSATGFMGSLSSVEEEAASGLVEIKNQLEALTAQGYVIDLTYNITQNTENNETGSTSYSVSINDDGASNTLANVATAMISVRSSASLLAQELDKVPDKSKDVKNTANEMEKLPDKSTNVKKTADAMTKLPNKYVAVNETAKAMNKLTSKSITASITVKVTAPNPTPGSTTSSTVSLTSSAKGNVALAKGKGTLMGELGPELVVSGGRYFTVGNNGAEFVNLADDAIVFNHLQTKKLLSSGSSTRGTPITNERNATSFATGNALASASQALAELKSIRAMWQALLDMDSSQLGAKAGSGSGSGGGSSPSSGGGGGGGSGSEESAVEYDLERWYNLLRQIAKLEQQITYEQEKRENLQSGYKYVDSLEKELVLLEKQLQIEKELASLQYDYYLKRMKDINSSAYSKIFTYDSEGLMQYVDGENRGLDALAKLQATDENGVLKMTAKQQYNYIVKTLGISANDLKYKSDGTEATEYADKVQVFFDNVDSIMDEMDELYDSYHEHAEKIEELTNNQNEILQEYVDNQRSLEDKLLQAIEDREQAIIDQMTDEREALEESSQDYISGLNDALTKEKNLYSQSQTDEETAKLQRRLAILQRSGGSTSEIKSLQDQIDSRLQDAYFQAQQDQIDAIQEASDNQLEKLQTQIDLMTETLEYQKENGLLWNEVYEIMNQWTPEQILQFIEQYTKSYQENSSLENAESSKETLKEAEIWAAKRDKNARDTAWASYYANANYSEDIKSANESAAQEAFNNAYATGGAEAGAEAANKIFDTAAVSSAPTETSPTEKKEEQTTSTPPAVTGKGTVKTKSGANLNVRKGPGTSYKKIGSYKNGSSVTLTGYKNGWYQVDYKGTKGYVIDDYISTSDKKKLPAYASGGLVDFTGPAWVDGSKSRPEAFLSAEDTALLKSNVFGSNGSLASIVAAIEEITKGASNYISSGSGITIENATVNIQPGVISNDYDARRAGEMALEEMVKIARKTTNRIVSR